MTTPDAAVDAPEPAAELAGGVLVVGTGLLGTSVALGLRAVGVDVQLEDPDPDALATAVQMGAGRRSVPTERAGLAVVAVPPGVAGDVAARLLNEDRAAYVTDVASVKALPAAQVRAAAREPGRYVGGHPMAGREVSGARSALPDLFEGRSWVLCPEDATDPRAVVRALAVARVCRASPVTMPVAEHDAAVALVSHAPHLISSLVAGLMRDAPAAQVRLAGPGVGDVTRIAAGDPALWSEILAVNSGAVASVMRELRTSIDEALFALEGTTAGDSPGGAGVGDALEGAGVGDEPGQLGAVLRRGVAGRARLPGKHGTRAASYEAVTVVVDDRPGQLAALFADAGDSGVNVEDVRIDHRPGVPMGAVELDVLPGRESELRAALRDRGWTVHG